MRHRVHNPKSISIGSSVFVQLIVVSKRHTDTDHAISVAIGRICALLACDAAYYALHSVFIAS